MAEGSRRTVVVAFAAGLGVAFAKIVAAVITGSPAMTAEASHSLADSANDLFLLFAQVRSQRAPDDLHPLGYGREAYFWALIAALGVFLAGAAFSLREGVDSLVRPSTSSSFLLAYVILAIATGLDLVSFRQSVRQMIEAAHSTHRGLVDQSVQTSDPILRGVFSENSVSVLGNFVAFVGLAISQGIGSSVPQGIAAVIIGVMLIMMSARLVSRNHDFLIGQPVLPAQQQQVRAFLLDYPDVTAVHQLLVIFLGPNQVWIVARVSINGSLRSDEIAALVRELDAGLRQASESVFRVDIVIVGNQ